MLGEYEPGSYIGRISPTPLLVVVARQDHLTPVHLALEAYSHAREPTDVVILPGTSTATSTGSTVPRQRPDWFVRHLEVGR